MIGTPGWVSAPAGFVLDIADFTSQGTRQGPLVGAIINLLVPITVSEQSGATANLSANVAMGALLSDLRVGIMGRFDNANTLDVFLPGVTLASVPDEQILAGDNVFALETAQGWEIFQAVNAALIAPDTYRLSRLLRGQSGTDYILGEILPAGARVVYLGRGWADIPISDELIGEMIEFHAAASGRADTETISHSYQANHLRPLAPVHLKTVLSGDDFVVTWIRRTRQGGDDWAAIEVPLGEEEERYLVL